MKVNAQSVNFNAEEGLIDFVQNRLNKLETFYDKVISSDVFLKLDNNNLKENKIVEIKLNVPRNNFIVKKQCKSFEEGADAALNSLGRQLKKHKEKLRAYLQVKKKKKMF